MKLSFRSALLASLATGAAAWLLLPLIAQSASDADIQARLRAEETTNSKAAWIMHEIADVHGPRLTGSPGLKAADDWVVATMTSWGLKNAHLEPYDFGHPGWANHLIEANVLSPYEAPLDVRALGWSPSTKGAVSAPAVLLLPPGLAVTGGEGGHGRGGRDAGPNSPAWAGTSAPPMPPPAAPPGPPTPAELNAYLNSMKAKVRGAIVLVGPVVVPPENFTPAPLRTPDSSWAGRFSGEPGAGRGGRGRGGAARGAAAPADPSRLTSDQVDVAVTKFLVESGALVRIENAGEAYDIIRAQDALGYNEAPQVPAMMMGADDYNRIARVLQDGTPVQLRVNLQNQFYPEGKTVYNAIGEIPGTDKADEVVMLGGHFDSWAGGTGATDNGAGSTIMLEAIRLLQTLHVQPRRTIRVALWSGEEEGIFGSQAYVAQHFGTAENPKPEFAKLDAYLNIDSGTGKPRGASVFGPPAAADFIANALAGFKDWGFYGASPTSGRSIGGTDSTSFNRAGLPGIGLSQDGFDYGTYTHHTNFDNVERVYEPDIREAAVEAAAAAYALAMAPEMLPRFQGAAMPPEGAGLAMPYRLLPASQRPPVPH